MDHAAEAAKMFDKHADAYLQRFADLTDYAEALDLSIQGLSKDASVLDLACGPGIVASQLLSQRPDLDYTGYDLSVNMVRLAAKQHPKAHFEVRDVREITVGQKKFDLILAAFILPYLRPSETKDLLGKLKGFLKPGGRIYVSFIRADKSKERVSMSSDGKDSLKQFLYSTSDVLKYLGVENYALIYQKEVRNTNGDDEAILLLSLDQG